MSCSFISTVTRDIDDVIEDAVKAVTDVGEAVKQLRGIIDGFNGLSEAQEAGRAPATVIDSDSLGKIFQLAYAAATKAVSSTYTKRFNAKPLATDKGFIKSYQTGASLKTARAELAQFLKNQGLGQQPDVVSAMINTLRSQVNAQHGVAGATAGIQTLNPNEQLNWAIAYGEYATSGGANALIYAFAVGVSTV